MSAACVLAPGVLADAPRYQIRGIGTFGGPFSDAHALNEAGQVVGTAAVSPTSAHAFLYDFDGGALTDLGTFGGAYSAGMTLGVNDAGDVVGSAMTCRGPSCRTPGTAPACGAA